MQPSAIDELFQRAIAQQRAGHLDEAASACRAVLQMDPRHAESCQMLGLIEHRRGQSNEALEWLRKAAELRPGDAGVLGLLGAVLAEQGRIGEAMEAFERALALRPDDAEIRYNYGKTLKQQGRFEEAVAAFEAAPRFRPGLRQAYNNLGNTLQEMGRFGDAIEVYRRALACGHDTAEVHFNLAVALHKSGQLESAVQAFQRAIALKPAYAEAYNNLGLALGALGRVKEAIGAYRKALGLRASAEVYSNLGTALRENDELDEAIAAYGKALELNPQSATMYCNLGGALNDVGASDQALALFRKAISLGDDLRVWDNYLFTLHFNPASTAQGILEEHRKWNRVVRSLNLQQFPRREPGRSEGRRLRIGYVSPDFRSHSQSFFTIPLLSHHDHDAFEIFCYSDVSTPDGLTARLQGYADVWRNTAGLGDDQLARLIHEDRIDILVDLTMHMAGNRLMVFARKPAAIQVTWLAYPGTTGLDTIDYRVSDAYLDPEGSGDSNYSERTIRPGPSFWCYDPLETEASVNELPALTTGRVTFGCLNSFFKVNAPTLDLWARVMQAAPESRLLLLAPRAGVRGGVTRYLATRGIAEQRVSFLDRRPRREYLRYYHEIDMCLDTIPYPGHTTSLDSLWMGVPVVTLAGETAISRGGLSILSNIGLADLAAGNTEEYVHIAAELAGNTRRMVDLRLGLRGRMKASPLMDASGFTRDLEGAFRTMWRMYCSD